MNRGLDSHGNFHSLLIMPASLQVGKVLQAVKTIHVHQETDYHLLFSTISLINYCLPDDSIAASDKVIY